MVVSGAQGLTNTARQVSEAGEFAAMSARRLFLLGGITLILTGMFFGDILAVFTLHQNAAQVGRIWQRRRRRRWPGIATRCWLIFKTLGRFSRIGGPKSIRTC